MEDQSNNDDGYSACSNLILHEPAEDMVSDVNSLESGDLRGVPAVQTIQDLSTISNVHEQDTLAADYGIIQYQISCIPRVFRLSDQVSEKQKTCEALEKKYEMEAYRLTDIDTQHKLLELRTADTLLQASTDLFPLSASLKCTLWDLQHAE